MERVSGKKIWGAGADFDRIAGLISAWGTQRHSSLGCSSGSRASGCGGTHRARGRPVYRDAGISGSKGQDQRPGFDAMHKDAARRRFNVVMARSVGRSTRSFVARSLRLPVRAAQPWHRPVPASAGHPTTPVGNVVRHPPLASRLPANSENAYHPR